MLITYLILAFIFLACLAIRSAYEALKDAGKIDPESRGVFAAIFSVMAILWFSWFLLCPIDPFTFNLPDIVRWFGFALFLIGLALFLGAVAQLRGFENIDHLVTTGLFARLRHPMYTGFLLWILGWSLYHGSLLSLAIGSIGVINILWWRLLEESRLLAQFGDSYRKYRTNTWF